MKTVSSIFGPWSEVLPLVGESPHLDHVINVLNPLYDSEKRIYPKRQDVFKAFRMVDPHNLRVVILGMDPYNDGYYATGYAFANPDDTRTLAPSLQKIQERIENDIYDGLYLNFDPTLEHWAHQGVLALNAALTVEHRKAGSHSALWRPLMTLIMRDLSVSYNNLFFCFWGKVAQEFSFLVDETKHTVLNAYHPAYAVRRHTPWECDHFLTINKELKQPIKW